MEPVPTDTKVPWWYTFFYVNDNNIGHAATWMTASERRNPNTFPAFFFCFFSIERQ